MWIETTLDGTRIAYMEQHETAAEAQAVIDAGEADQAEWFQPRGPVEDRAARIDPRTAICFNSHYGEDFPLEGGGWVTHTSSGLIWAAPDFSDGVPDWAMREVWKEQGDQWEGLTDAAWERCH